MRTHKNFAGARTKKFRATQSGVELLSENKDLAERIKQFCSHDIRPEDCFRGAKFIAKGTIAQVWNIGGVAVKISTPTTSVHSWEAGHPARPKNLINQFDFTRALDVHLSKDKESGVIVPEPFFALRSQYGSYLYAQKNMVGWHYLGRAFYEHKIAAIDHERDTTYTELSSVIKNRINAAMLGSPLRLGLDDLGLNQGETLHNGNILVPISNAPLETSPLCIIDQPHGAINGKTALILNNLFARD
jgi:hypothetical protein